MTAVAEYPATKTGRTSNGRTTNADGRLALLRHNLQNVQGGEQIFAFVQELIAEAL